MLRKFFKQKKSPEDDGVAYFNSKGRKSKRPPKGVPLFEKKPLLDGEGVSPENGIPAKPELDSEVKKRVKKKI